MFEARQRNNQHTMRLTELEKNNKMKQKMEVRESDERTTTPKPR